VSPSHVVVIGAARSGTKLLRDALTAALGAGSVPYDIGYVWRFGNEDLPDDVLSAEQMSAKTRRYVVRFIDRYAAGDPSLVVEKTVGNTLRVAAVAATLPDAYFIHLIRDGIDVAESTRRQWMAAPDPRYLVAKLRHFPLRLIPTYGVRYVRSFAHRSRDPQHRVGTWGPRYPAIDVDLRSTDLLTVCARQWRESVTRACHDLAHLRVKVAEVRYEDLVADPVGELDRLARFVDPKALASRVAAAAAAVSADRRGHGRDHLAEEELARLDAELGSLLVELGYERPARDGDVGLKELGD
jgi:hypothetical protein